MKKLSWNEGWKVAINGEKAKTITLPHDALQETGRNKKSKSGQAGAYFNGGIYRYQKKFIAPEEWRNLDVIFEIEGVYPTGKVSLNGKELGFCSYGYLDYRFFLKDLVIGEENVLEVYVDHTNMPDSRWYSGGGLYRPVFLWVGEKSHIIPEGIKVQILSLNPAKIKVSVERTDQTAEIRTTILSDGMVVMEAGEGEITIPDAKLWNIDAPHLYECRVELNKEGKLLDVASTSFGIRDISWSKDGLFINGKQTLLRGGCIHHDNGIVGAREYKESAYRRVKCLKSMGFNAIRYSHYPASREVLEACDMLGMYVMDETWDMWYKSKSPYDYAKRFMKNWEADITAVVNKDYNHPSVIMYSIGNEVTEPGKKQGVALGRQLIEQFHHLDSSRPVTAGINITLLMLAAMGIDLTKSDDSEKMAPKKEMNSTDFNKMMSSRGEQMSKVSLAFPADLASRKILDALDIAGYNYATARYKVEKRKHPNRVIVGSETYPHQLAENWKWVEKLPYLIGDFMWTCWDYLGEAGIGAWTWSDGSVGFDKPYPWLLADTGVFDILGNDNAEAGNAAVIWGARTTPYIGVVPVNHPWQNVIKAMWRGSNAIPHWSYQNCEGISTQVEVYSQGAEIELFLNGQSVGREKLVDYKAVFHPSYQTGVLKAVSYDEEGNRLGESNLKSAEGKLQISIKPEEKLTDDDILYLAIDIIGANGEVECNADTMLQIQVENGELLAFGSANPKTEEDFLAHQYTTYYGRAQAVVKKMGKSMKITVLGENLETTELVVDK